MEANLRIYYRLIVIVVLLASAFSFSASQTVAPDRDSSGPGLPSCWPAPCVLPPTQVSPGPKPAYDAPIAADPSNPKHLIVGSNDYSCAAEESLGFYVSPDSGSSWNQVCMSSRVFDGQEYSPADGPILGYDRDGVAYIGGAYGSSGSGGKSWAPEAFEKSSDGVTWSAPAPAVVVQNYFPDYCWMTVDTNATSPYMNSIYVSCVMIGSLNRDNLNHVVVSHSNDGGTTWHQVAVAHAQMSPDVDSYTDMTVGQNGTVYLTWMYCNSGFYFCDDDYGYMVFSMSSDGGNTWTPPVLVATVVLNHGNVPNTKVGVPDTPVIGVDNSTGPHAGSLYVVMYNWTGTFMQVQVVRSTDGGSTWSKPVPVAPGITHDQFLPWMSVSPTGLVGISWLDRRNDPANVDYQAFAAISSDGGLSFLPNVQLTTGFSDPDGEGLLSNYIGNTWDGPNYFLAAWIDDSNSMYMQDVVGGVRLK
jgi:hypothetical protein